MATLSTMPKYEAYRDSGFNWIGKIPNDWEVTKLKHIAKIINGDSLAPDLKDKFSFEVDEYWPYIASKDINVNTSFIDYENGIRIPYSYTNYKLAPNNSALICIEGGSAGRKIAYTNQNVCYVNKLACIYSKHVSNRFIYYSLYAEAFQTQFKLSLSGLIGGVAISAMNNFFIVNPPLEEQNNIVNFLYKKTTQINEAITIKEKQIVLLKERKQIIIQKAVTQGLNPNVPMKDSGVEWIGKIPEHWDVKKLKYIINFIGGGTPSKENQRFWGGDICWVSPKDMKRKFISNSIDKITELAVSKSSVKLVPKNTVLIVVRGMILAKKIPVAVAMKPLTINQDMKGLIVSPICHSNFLMNLLDGLHEELSTILEESGHGTKTMPTEKLGNFKLPLPPQSEQKTIIEYIEKTSRKYDASIQLQQQQIQKLKEYKTTLINSAVTGKIKIEGYGHDA